MESRLKPGLSVLPFCIPRRGSTLATTKHLLLIVCLIEHRLELAAKFNLVT